MNYFCAECLRAIDYIDTQIPAYRKTIAPPRGWLAARLYHPEWLHYSIFLTARNLADAERILTERQAIEIIRLSDVGVTDLDIISAIPSSTRNIVQKIRHRRTWKHLTLPSGTDAETPGASLPE